MRSLLDTREHCLNEFSFPDPYSKVSRPAQPHQCPEKPSTVRGVGTGEHQRPWFRVCVHIPRALHWRLSMSGPPSLSPWYLGHVATACQPCNTAPVRGASTWTHVAASGCPGLPVRVPCSALGTVQVLLQSLGPSSPQCSKALPGTDATDTFHHHPHPTPGPTVGLASPAVLGSWRAGPGQQRHLCSVIVLRLTGEAEGKRRRTQVLPVCGPGPGRTGLGGEAAGPG